MDIGAVAASGPAVPAGTSAAPPADDAAVFAAMVQGVLTTGLTLMNSVASDTLEALNEPFGDPDQ